MSSKNAEDLRSPPLPILPPPVPKPTASGVEVREFLIQFLLSQDWKSNLEEAQEKAKKIAADGKALYEFSKKDFTDQIGIAGEAMYRALQASEYGYEGGLWPQLKVAGALGFLVGLLNGGWQLRIERSRRDYTISIILAAIITALIIFHSFCKSSSVVDSKWWPERLKIRR